MSIYLGDFIPSQIDPSRESRWYTLWYTHLITRSSTACISHYVVDRDIYMEVVLVGFSIACFRHRWKPGRSRRRVYIFLSSELRRQMIGINQ